MLSQTRLLRHGTGLPLLLVTLGVLLSASGCSPQNIGRYNEVAFGAPRRVTNRIMKTHDDWYGAVSYWIQDATEEPMEFPGPMPTDLEAPKGDYILGADDLLAVTILDLFQQGVAYRQEVRVSQEGNITLPYLQNVKAAGFTARGLEQRLAEMLKVNLLKQPRVSVFVTEYRNRFYSLLSGVRQPGMYPLMTTSMKLVQALSVAGGVLPYTEDTMWVHRELSQEEFDRLLLTILASEKAKKNGEKGKTGETTGAAAKGDASQRPSDSATPVASERTSGLTPLEELQLLAEGREVPSASGDTESTMAAARRPATPEGEIEAPLPPSSDESAQAAVSETPAPETAESATPATATTTTDTVEGEDWKWENGRWVLKTPSAPAKKPVAETPSAEKKPENLEELSPELRRKLAEFGVVQGGKGISRILRIDVPSLLRFDPTQNIVLRNGDVINIPEPPSGEWYIDGEVVRRGVYSLTGRKITLLQAVAAAGGLTQLAIPQRTELVRRISEQEEEIIYVDLAKIAKGEAPDFYLQPNDLIRVGTDQGAIFLAVLRNAFRATYGFGLVYDQNFADIYPWKGEVHPLF